MKAWLLAGLVGVVSHAGSPETMRALDLYQSTNYQAALKVLLPLQEKDAEAHLLIGKSFYMTGEYKKATDSIQHAVDLKPASSEYAVWLGRAYGRRAETSNYFTAPSHAAKARHYFEKAVQLNPRNSDAVNDLFEYYLEAPGFLGGGLDKAAMLTKKIQELDPAEYHYALAHLAEKQKEFNNAEQHFRRALELAPRSVGRFVDLASFLSKQGKFQESETVFRQAETIAPKSPKLLYGRADTYVKSKRNLETARALLRRYILSPLTPDDPSRADAEKLLRRAEGKSEGGA